MENKLRMTVTLLDHTSEQALVEARIYAGGDQAEDLLANAYAVGYRQEDEHFIETAQEAALHAALAFLRKLEETSENSLPAFTPAPAEKPQPRRKRRNIKEPADMAEPAAESQAAPLPKTEEADTEAAASMPSPTDSPAPGTEEKTEDTPSRFAGTEPEADRMPPVNPPVDIQPESAPEQSDTVEEMAAAMTFEEAGNTVISAEGIYKGMTLAQATGENPKLLEWFSNRYFGSDLRLKAAAHKLCQGIGRPLAG